MTVIWEVGGSPLVPLCPHRGLGFGRLGVTLPLPSAGDQQLCWHKLPFPVCLLKLSGQNTAVCDRGKDHPTRRSSGGSKSKSWYGVQGVLRVECQGQ